MKEKKWQKKQFQWVVCNREIQHSHLDPVGDQWKWQQQNKALNPHEEELYYEIGNPDSPQNLPETQWLNGWAEEDEAGKLRWNINFS